MQNENELRNFSSLSALYESKEYLECLKYSNQVGKALLKKITQTEGPKVHLYLCELKQIIHLTTECVKKVHCKNCQARHLAKTFRLFFLLKEDRRLAIGIRQECGTFLNELLSLKLLRENGHLLPPSLRKRKHHLLIVSS